MAFQVQAKADRQSNKKEKELEQRKKRMAAAGEGGGGGDLSADSSQQNAAAAAAATMSFSDMVGVRTGGGGGADDRRASVLAGSMPAVKTKAVMGSVFKKAGVNLLQKQAKAAAAQNAQVKKSSKKTNHIVVVSVLHPRMQNYFSFLFSRLTPASRSLTLRTVSARCEACPA